jgi:hypothetical protein
MVVAILHPDLSNRQAAYHQMIAITWMKLHRLQGEEILVFSGFCKYVSFKML